MSDNNLKISRQEPWIIQDWAGNLMDFGRFKTFEDAEEFLCEKLNDDYETDRGEYYIIEDTRNARVECNCGPECEPSTIGKCTRCLLSYDKS